MMSYLYLAFLLGIFRACSVSSIVFEQTQYAVVEGEAFEYCLLGVEPLATDMLINITRSYAVGGAVFNDQIPLSAGFDAGDTECITVDAGDNARLDDGNTITLSIDDSDSPDAEVEVFDDEIVQIGFSVDEYSAVEGMVATVCVEILEAEDALGRSIPFRICTDYDADPVIFEPFKDISLLPLRSDEGDTVCFGISLVPNTIDNDDYRSFTVHIELFSINVYLLRPYTTVHVFADEPCDPVFINDTPRVDGNDISVEVSDCVFSRGLACSVELMGISGSMSCVEGGVTVSTGSNRPRTLTVTIPEINVTLERTVRRDHDVCDSHLINEGITSNGSGNVMVEFEGTGPSADVQVSEFRCTVTDDNGSTEEDCVSPYMFPTPTTATGSFFFDILPSQVGGTDNCRRRPSRRFTLDIPMM